MVYYFFSGVVDTFKVLLLECTYCVYTAGSNAMVLLVRVLEDRGIASTP